MIAEKFAYYRQLWSQYHHSGPMPHAFLTRHVHVAETDAQARAEAEPNLLMGYIQGGELIAKTRLGFGPPGLEAAERSTPERQELRRVFQECSKSYDFWIDNGLALVGSPDTVIRKIEEQRQLTGYDIFCRPTSDWSPGAGAGPQIHAVVCQIRHPSLCLGDGCAEDSHPRSDTRQLQSSALSPVVYEVYDAESCYPR